MLRELARKDALVQEEHRLINLDPTTGSWGRPMSRNEVKYQVLNAKINRLKSFSKL